MGNSGAKSSPLHTEDTTTGNLDSVNMEIPSHEAKKDVHVQNCQIPGSSLSSGSKESQSVNHSEKVESSASSMSINPASVQNKGAVLICNKPKVTHAAMTLAQYRKTVGIKVVNQKSSQKIGIVANPISAQEPESNPNILASVGKGSLCPFCGYTSSLTSKCERCARTFSSDRVKIVDLAPLAVKAIEVSKTSVMPQLSKESFYGSRRPRSQAVSQIRQGRSKTEEPQCVTLSSDDEEDSCSEAKKIKGHLIDDGQPVARDFLQVAPLDTSACNKDYSVDPACTGPVSSSPTNPSSDDPSYPIMESSDASGLASNDALDSDMDTALARWKEGGLKGPFSAVAVRSARVGSYKCVPTDRVLLSSEGISLKIPVMEKDGRPSKTETVNVAIPTKNMLDVQVHFSRTLSVIFLRTAPSVSRNVSKALGLSKGPYVPYWDQLSEQESQKRLTLLPHDLDETSKNAIKQAFALSGIYKEINAVAANNILVKSSPQDPSIPADVAVTPAESPALLSSSSNSAANKENGFKVEIRTRSSSKAVVRPTPIPVERMFSWSDGPDRFSVTTEDYVCLNQDNLLNDSIIDFYLRYVFSTKLDDDQKKKCYVFSSFFYQRLTTRPPRVSGRKHPIEDDTNLDIAEKRHSRVKSWTKRVDIFEKDFLIIPINERAHWFLAIVCFAGLSGPVTMKDNRPVDIPKQQQMYPKKVSRKPFNKLPQVATGESFMIGNTTVTPVGIGSNKGLKSSTVISVDTDRDEAESDDEGVTCNNDYVTLDSAEIYEPIKQPCILFFDSMASSSHFRVAATLRDYLKIEYQVKRSDKTVNNGSGTGSSCESHHKLFSKEVMLSACPSVPQQNNSYDCGVFVLQYAEAFMKKPLSDFYIHKIQLSKWFTTCMANRKRKDIQYLLIRLTKEKNNSADSILRLLPENDVRIALQTRNPQNAETLAYSTQVDGTFQRDPTEDLEMEEKAPEVVPQAKCVSLEGNLCESHPEDNVFMEN